MNTPDHLKEEYDKLNQAWQPHPSCLRHLLKKNGKYLHTDKQEKILEYIENREKEEMMGLMEDYLEKQNKLIEEQAEEERDYLSLLLKEIGQPFKKILDEKGFIDFHLYFYKIGNEFKVLTHNKDSFFYTMISGKTADQSHWEWFRYGREKIEELVKRIMES